MLLADMSAFLPRGGKGRAKGGLLPAGSAPIKQSFLKPHPALAFLSVAAKEARKGSLLFI